MFFIEWRRLLESSQHDSEQLYYSPPVHTKGILLIMATLYVSVVGRLQFCFPDSKHIGYGITQ